MFLQLALPDSSSSGVVFVVVRDATAAIAGVGRCLDVLSSCSVAVLVSDWLLDSSGSLADRLFLQLGRLGVLLGCCRSLLLARRLFLPDQWRSVALSRSSSCCSALICCLDGDSPRATVEEV